jgi:hypothetical protein
VFKRISLLGFNTAGIWIASKYYQLIEVFYTKAAAAPATLPGTEVGKF